MLWQWTNDVKFEKELTCQFKTDMKNLTNFDPSTWKCQKFTLCWASFDQTIECLSLESTGELCLTALKIDTKFEGKLTGPSKNDMRNLANSHQSTWKSQN